MHIPLWCEIFDLMLWMSTSLSMQSILPKWASQSNIVKGSDGNSCGKSNLSQLCLRNTHLSKRLFNGRDKNAFHLLSTEENEWSYLSLISLRYITYYVLKSENLCCFEGWLYQHCYLRKAGLLDLLSMLWILWHVGLLAALVSLNNISKGFP